MVRKGNENTDPIISALLSHLAYSCFTLSSAYSVKNIIITAKKSTITYIAFVYITLPLVKENVAKE